MKPDEIQKANHLHLKIFEEWLKDKGLSNKTINNHIINVKFYIDDYLCGYFEADVKQGCYKIDSFLGDWFIRKAVWSSCAYIREYAASFKKFYACMLENNVVEQKDYDTLCETIKNYKSEWLDAMKRFDEMDELDFF